MLIALLAAVILNQTAAGQIVIHVDKPLHKISPTFYGLMTEEINHSYDGGLYAELIQNRSFQDDPKKPVGWESVGAATLGLQRDGDVASLRVEGGGVANKGFWGISAQPNTKYALTLIGSSQPGAQFSVSLQSADGNHTWASATTIPTNKSGWQTYHMNLRTGDCPPSTNNRLAISSVGQPTFELRYVSLFPPTFHNRPNGNRVDLMDLLKGLKPAFLRFPGGNYLEGDTIATRFDWKKTLGPPSDRPGHQGPWGYRSSDGMGLLEFLEWCEDLKMQPVLGVYAGYSLKGEYVKPGPDLKPYVQDALDEIQFITGDTNTKWGQIRAKLGHPKPFSLRYVEIGNEDWFDRSGSYDGRFAQFYDAIKAKYPHLQLIATAEVKSRQPDVMDDHYYRSAQENALDWTHYDQLSRVGPKIFVGEWASTEGHPTPTLAAALGDAAWLMGLERNSDLVKMEAYAPLLVNVESGAAQWGTNLIGYNAGLSFGSTSYWVQSLFAKNAGDEVLSVQTNIQAPAKAREVYHGGFGLRTYETSAEFKDITVDHDGTTTDLAPTQFASEKGDWKTDSESLFQNSLERNTFARALVGDPSWTSYTIHLKARKISGREGFMIVFHSADHSAWQWNIGGWGDTRSALQHLADGRGDEIGEATRTTIATGYWYTIELSLRGGVVRGYIDGKPIMEIAEALPQPLALYTEATYDSSTHSVILKAANMNAFPVAAEVDLAGTRQLSKEAKEWVIEGKPLDQNTIAEPNKIRPRFQELGRVGRNFAHTFAPYSVTVIRIESSL